MSKRKRRIFSRELKLSAVQRMLAGESTKVRSWELGIAADHLDRWCQQFRRYGAAEGGTADIQPRDLAPAVTVDADRDDHCDRYDPPVLANFDVGGVDPQIGPIALDRPMEKRLHLLVDLRA